MNASPDLLHELRASRPTAPSDLRARVRAITAQETERPVRPVFRLPVRRLGLVVLPVAAALALVSAGAIGLSRSGDVPQALEGQRTESLEADQAQHAPEASLAGTAAGAGRATDADRAQRISATLTLEVRDSDAVSRAAQDALDLTRALGGHVVSASVATGQHASATLTVRIPVAKVQSAIARLSALGRIVSQQVQVEDLQETLDQLDRRKASVQNQIARITARLESESLDAETRAVLESRRKNLRAELHSLRTGIASTTAEARMATIQLTVATPEVLGTGTAPSRLDRTLDEALNVLAWEAVVGLAVAIVMAPLVLIALAALIGRRFYRRREEDRLLAAS